ncbi:uncharacterized protein LOC144887683 [Branchiostoma floridae x Branchiostoma japonicum]
MNHNAKYTVAQALGMILDGSDPSETTSVALDDSLPAEVAVPLAVGTRLSEDIEVAMEGLHDLNETTSAALDDSLPAEGAVPLAESTRLSEDIEVAMEGLHDLNETTSAALDDSLPAEGAVPLAESTRLSEDFETDAEDFHDLNEPASAASESSLGDFSHGTVSSIEDVQEISVTHPADGTIEEMDLDAKRAGK